MCVVYNLLIYCNDVISWYLSPCTIHFRLLNLSVVIFVPYLLVPQYENHFQACPVGYWGTSLPISCGSVAAVARCASYDAHLATAPQHIPTQHDILPQHLVYKYELNCEYCNITLARNKAPWWWPDKIEICRGVSKCFMWNFMCIRWLLYWNARSI